MDDIGFQGTGSRFNTRFGAGEDIYASQLNGLAAGIQSALGMPYLGAGQSVSFVPGGNIIAGPSPVENAIGAAVNINTSLKYVNHYEIQVGTMFLDSILVPTPTLKVAKGGNVWRPAASECVSEYRADTIITDGTLPVVSGANPASPWAANDGYIVITPGVLYYVYVFKLEVGDVSSFFIYVSTDGTLTSACPCPPPPGFSPPVGVDYNLQGILLGTASIGATFLPSVSQHVVGSITWPNLGNITPEYVNHYEAKVTTVDVEGSPTVVLKVGRGGNIWNPSINGEKNALEKRVDVMTNSPEVYAPVNGSDTNSPWANDDGYIVLEGVSVYVYAYKVTSNAGATTDFYIYVSESSTLVDPVGGQILLPSGITAPSGDYTVQGVRVADVVWNGLEGPPFYVSQRVVGSITWPDYVPPRIVQQFECVVDSLTTEAGDIDALRIAKGDILWSYAPFTSSAHDSTPVQGHAKKLWVYPTGTITEDVDPALPWVNGGGYIHLDREQTYGVYIIGNQDSAYFGGAVSLAVIANGSDAYTKTRPFRSGYMGRGWESVFKNGLVVDGSTIYSPFYQFDRLKNYNCQRYLVATVAWSGTAWTVTQYLYGPVTLSNDLDNAGPHVWEEDPPGPDFQTEQDAWNGAWSGYTKDGSPTDCTDIVWVS